MQCRTGTVHVISLPNPHFRIIAHRALLATIFAICIGRIATSGLESNLDGSTPEEQVTSILAASLSMPIHVSELPLVSRILGTHANERVRLRDAARFTDEPGNVFVPIGARANAKEGID